MNISDYRKKIFLNSQYCNYYNENNGTVLAGILRKFGYMYSVVLPDEKLKEISKTYRKFTTIVNTCVAAEIILYIYLIVFPFFTSFMKMPFITAVFVLSLIPLLMLYLTYLGINYLYENYLTRYVGTFRRTTFNPSLKNIDEKTFENYQKTPRKSVYILSAIIVIFCLYAFVPVWVENLNLNKKFDTAVKVSNVYLAFVPISAEVYANRAYAKFNLKQYKSAEKDYEAANKYSLSDNYSEDILGVKTYYQTPQEMIKDFDAAIAAEKDEPVKYLLQYEKATYLLKIKDYNSALNIYNTILGAYKQKKKVFFSPARAYYNRGTALNNLGDINGAKIDFAIARRMCPECTFTADTTLVQRP